MSYPHQNWIVAASLALVLACSRECSQAEALPPLAPTGSVNLEWDPSPSSDVIGYRLHFGLSSGQYTELLELGNATSVTVLSLLPEFTYYFAVTAYDAGGVESDFSNELAYEVPMLNGNHRPRAKPDLLYTGADVPRMVEPANLLANDEDSDHDALMLVDVPEVSSCGGTITFDGTNVTYIPSPGFSGRDSFLYTISDGREGSATNTVSVVVLEPAKLVIESIPNLASSASKSSANSAAIIVFLGEPWSDYQLLISDDLATWEPGPAVSSSEDGVIRFEDDGATGKPSRFYQVHGL